ncbi:hypothetical protein ACFTAO_03665 [Paenibacillus rhizoplanae]
MSSYWAAARITPCSSSPVMERVTTLSGLGVAAGERVAAGGLAVAAGAGLGVGGLGVAAVDGLAGSLAPADGSVAAAPGDAGDLAGSLVPAEGSVAAALGDAGGLGGLARARLRWSCRTFRRGGWYGSALSDSRQRSRFVSRPRRLRGRGPGGQLRAAACLIRLRRGAAGEQQYHQQEKQRSQPSTAHFK